MTTSNPEGQIGPTQQVAGRTAGVMAGDRVPPGSDPRMHAGDALPPDAPNAGETICYRCNGQGKLEGGETCPECEGKGRVIESVAGGP
jgi:RecJ-like exonuclease